MATYINAVFIDDSVEYTTKTVYVGCNSGSKTITLSADTDGDVNDFVWLKGIRVKESTSFVQRWFKIAEGNDVDITIQPELVGGASPIYKCVINDDPVIESNILSPTPKFRTDDIQITFYANPQTVDYDEDSMTYESVNVTWNVVGASNVYVTINGVQESVSATDSTVAIVEESQTISISAVSSGCAKTYELPIVVNTNVSACMTKADYISLIVSEFVRFGDDRKINLTNYNPDFRGREINVVVELFEEYLNTMFAGDNGLAINSTPTSATNVEYNTYRFQETDDVL